MPQVILSHIIRLLCESRVGDRKFLLRRDYAGEIGSCPLKMLTLHRRRLNLGVVTLGDTTTTRCCPRDIQSDLNRLHTLRHRPVVGSIIFPPFIVPGVVAFLVLKFAIMSGDKYDMFVTMVELIESKPCLWNETWEDNKNNFSRVREREKRLSSVN